MIFAILWMFNANFFVAKLDLSLKEHINTATADRSEEERLSAVSNGVRVVDDQNQKNASLLEFKERYESKLLMVTA